MKLNRRIIVIIITLDIIAILVDMSMIFFVELFKNGENKKRIEEKIPIQQHYTCKEKLKRISDKKLNITYYIESIYEFSFDENYKIDSSELKNTYVFETDTDYNTFKENDQITYINEQEYEPENRTIKYSFLGLYPNTTNEKQDYFTKEYIDLLKEKGFDCE